jgi:hypothetical protein
MSDVVNNIQSKGQTHAMELIFFPIIVLLFVGLFTNELSTSGLQTVPILPSPFCTGSIEPGECYPLNQNGCDQAIQDCNFTTSTTFSFLNPNSPFTILLQGNIVGFFSSTFNGAENQQIIYSAYTICIPQVNKVYANDSSSDIHFFQCLGYSSQGGNASVPAKFPNTGIPLNATSNNGNNSQWSITGCLLVNNNYPCTLNVGDGIEAWNGTNSQMAFYGFYTKNGTTFTATSGCTIYGSSTACNVLMPWLFHSHTSFTCPSTAHINGININATTYYCLFPVNNPTVGTVGNASLPNAFSGLSFLFGAILFFLGFGLSISSAIIGFNINEQGTKLAQVMGIGILVWSFIYGEFGSWLLFLPFNLGLITFTSFTVMFFMGLYWRMFSWE